MNIICQGHHCPVRNQCANYEKNLDAKTATDTRRIISSCTNQKSFKKVEV